MDISTLLLRLAATFVLSSLYGVARQFTHKPIGFGTFTFVATGSCALAIAALHISPNNPLPLLGAIVTGIGFLGAGALIRTGEKVAGFTSAALIWIFAVFGLTIGAGQYELGGTVYVMIWLVTLYDRTLERRGIGAYYRKISITTRGRISEADIRAAIFGGRKHTLLELRGDKSTDSLTVTYSVEGTHVHLKELTRKLDQSDWCSTYVIE